MDDGILDPTIAPQGSSRWTGCIFTPLLIDVVQTYSIARGYACPSVSIRPQG